MDIAPRVLGVRFFFVLVIFLVALAMYLLIGTWIESQPECDLARSAVVASPAIQETFGSPLLVKPGPAARYLRSSTDGNSGTYSFVVDGTKASGTVYVEWSNPGNGVEFTVESLEIELAGETRKQVAP